MGGVLTTLDLTEDQQKKIDKVRAACRKKIEKILSDEQKAKLKKACAAKGCNGCSSEKKKNKEKAVK